MRSLLYFLLIFAPICVESVQALAEIEEKASKPQQLWKNTVWGQKLCQGRPCTDKYYPLCSLSGCAKRGLQEDVGPFWANRGKKDPNYHNEPLYVEEPRWILIRKVREDNVPIDFDEDPFFVTRGKKVEAPNWRVDDGNAKQSQIGRFRERFHRKFLI